MDGVEHVGQRQHAEDHGRNGDPARPPHLLALLPVEVLQLLLLQLLLLQHLLLQLPVLQDQGFGQAADGLFHATLLFADTPLHPREHAAQSLQQLLELARPLLVALLHLALQAIELAAQFLDQARHLPVTVAPLLAQFGQQRLDRGQHHAAQLGLGGNLLLRRLADRLLLRRRGGGLRLIRAVAHLDLPRKMHAFYRRGHTATRASITSSLPGGE